MLIEYTIKFEKGGVTVTQRVEPGPSTEANVKSPPTAARALSVKLPDSFPGNASAHLEKPGAEVAKARSQAPEGGASEDKKGTGGGSEDKKGTGGGDEDKKGPGGGGPQSALIVFGPIVIVGSGGAFGIGEGGGDEDKKGTP